ncbi:MAG: DUF4424 family protein [Rhodocyclales bacterium]|nr:DUF4424 family protein [Rhodocyclales bacterium]
MRLLIGVILLAFGALALAPRVAIANDGIGSLGVGGIVAYGKTDAVAMRTEVLEISTSRIDVAYEFVNESSEPVTLSVVFPLPPYGAMLPSPGWGGQPPNFSLTIDGEARQFEVGIRATNEWSDARPRGADVTNELKLIGLSPQQIAVFPGAFDKPGTTFSMFEGKRAFALPVTPVQRRKLIAAGLLVPDPGGLLDAEADFPAWEAHITYAWTITFPPGKIVSVKHSYAPFLTLGGGADLYAAYIRRDSLKDFCASPVLVNRLQQLIAPHESMPGTQVRYILKTANTWKGPIKSFTLRLKKSSPKEFISLCFPGDFVKVDALTLESRLEDFSPAEDLHIQYLDPTRTIEYGKNMDGFGEAPRIPGGLAR